MASGHLITAVPAPLIVHVLQMITRNVRIFAHHLVIVVLLYVVMPWPLHWSMPLALPGFAILFLALLGGSVALGMLCVRFRDIGSAIVSGLQFVFFLTPIIWTEDSARQRLDEIVARAGVLVLASHDIELIQSTCSRAILLEPGRIIAAGGTDTILAQYLAGSGARKA